MDKVPLAYDWKLDYPWWRLDAASVVKNRLLYQIVFLMKAKRTLEIGVGRYGNGVYWFGHHAKEVDGHHTAIDVHSGNIGRSQIVVDDFDLPVTLINKDTKDVAWGERIPLCYVDGGHAYDQVANDIKKFARCINRGGLIIFDDYGKTHRSGVYEAVNEFYNPELFEMFTLPWAWWAIWRRK